MTDTIDTNLAFQASSPFSQAIRAGDFLFVSGIAPLAPGTDRTVVGETPEEQMHEVFRNLKAILEAGGATLDQVVKVSLFLEDMDSAVPSVNAVFREYFNAPFPARFCVGADLQGFKVELDAIAYLGDSGRGAGA